MRLVILSQYYPPEVGAPQARLSELAERFVRRGHQVTVVTGMPSYPAGRIHDGYGGFFKREQGGGVTVVRTYVHPTQRTATLPRLLNYLSFSASSSLLAPWIVNRADYLLAESPPLLVGPAAWWLSRLCRARLIFNVSDLWPESAVRLGVLDRQSRAFAAAAALEAFCYRQAWLVTGQSRSIISNIQARFPEVPTFHLSNGVDTRRFVPEARDSKVRQALAMEGQVVVLYAGLHGLAQGLDQLLSAAARVAGDQALRFVLMGDGPEKSALMAEAQRRGLSNVSFLPSRPLSEMPTILASADIVVVPLKTALPGAVPSKLYEAMATGRPIVLMASGEAADIVREHHAGLVVRSGDIDGFLRAIFELRADSERALELGRRARRAAEQHFDRDAICSRFIEHLETELLTASRGSVDNVRPGGAARPNSRGN